MLTRGTLRPRSAVGGLDYEWPQDPTPQPVHEAVTGGMTRAGLPGRVASILLTICCTLVLGDRGGPLF